MTSSLGHIGHVVKSFLQRYSDQKNPLLIAYSGGGDSKALLYAAIEWGKAPLHIAHVDHGWRKESFCEATSLGEEAKELGIPFHSIRLSRKTTELEARECRYEFFATLQKQYCYQAILLGHQADDLAETVLKRLFEGAHLSQLGAMKEVSAFGEMMIWRPLLKLSKEEIAKCLVRRGLSAIQDPSNRDLHYLRARFREEIIPYLNRSFQKNISKNLVEFSDRAQEWAEYLSWRAQSLQDQCCHGPFGWWIDSQNLHRVELRYLILQLANRESIDISRPVLESILEWMEKKDGSRAIDVQERRIIIDRGHFFLLARKLPLFIEPISVNGSLQRSGDWCIQEITPTLPICEWRELWKKGIAIQRFEQPATLALPTGKMKWKEKVPAFLRNICPVIVQNGRIASDFLTARAGRGERAIKIFIEM